MITIFNRKRLMTDLSLTSISTSTQILEENYIEYYRRAISDGMFVYMQRRFQGKKPIIYMIYVRKCDYKKARKLLSLDV